MFGSARGRSSATAHCSSVYVGVRSIPTWCGARSQRQGSAWGCLTEAAFAGGGVQVVTVPIDYTENMRVLVDELKNRVPAAPSAEPTA